MNKLFNRKEAKKKRKYLRNNMTKAEIFLWSKLKRKQLSGYKFRRQYSINNYVVDFFCPEIKLAIELDGAVHGYESNIRKDKKRQNEIEALGIKVLRFSNCDIFENMDEVLNNIANNCKQKD